MKNLTEYIKDITGISTPQSQPIPGSTQAFGIPFSIYRDFIHQTGIDAFEALQSEFQKRGVKGEITPFLSDMPAAFAKADLIITGYFYNFSSCCRCHARRRQGARARRDPATASR